MFDGYHLGHQAIVRDAVARSGAPGERTAVLTFAEHPTAFLRPDDVPPQIATMAERVNAFARAGIDEAFVLTFDESIASLVAGSVSRRRASSARSVRVRWSWVRLFASARSARAMSRSRKRTWRARGREAIGVPNAHARRRARVEHAHSRGDCGRPISCWPIGCSGVPYTVRGIVDVRCRSRPRSRVSDGQHRRAARENAAAGRRVRDRGRHDGHDYPGLVSIGTNPTFDGTARTVEAWLLDFMGSLYGEELALRDFRFVREQKRFDSVDDAARTDARRRNRGRLFRRFSNTHGPVAIVRSRRLRWPPWPRSSPARRAGARHSAPGRRRAAVFARDVRRQDASRRPR